MNALAPRRKSGVPLVSSILALACLALAWAGPAVAQIAGITEVGAGVNGNANAQYVELRMKFAGENLWGLQPGESASRMVLTFFDGGGNQTGEFAFTANPPNALNRYVLVGTQAFKDLTSQPDPDILIPAGLIKAGSGRVCFRSNRNNPNTVFADCIAYGNFPASRNNEIVATEFGNVEFTFGTPVANQLPTAGLSSVQRREGHDVIFGFGFADTSDNQRDFALAGANPARSGSDLPQDSAADIARGRQLFTEETFGGNGRTCASCHVLELNAALPPANVAQRFATLATTFDPLFIAEKNMNLNTLTVHASAGFAEGAVLTGTAAGAPAKVKVRARLSSTTFLVHGGIDPRLTAGTNITDGTSTVRVVSIAKGDLDQLEDPRLMRGPSVSPAHPHGRGLILENVDGFGVRPVFRKSPHLQNLKFTGPFGFHDQVPDLEQFSIEAVVQHFPRTLARRPGIDFRLPTAEEQRLLKVFMRSLDSIPGSSLAELTSKHDLGHFARTAAQRRGRELFQNTSCNSCHFSPVLSGGRFPTGVNNQPIDGPAPGGDGLPMDSDVLTATTNRAMGTPGLFNVKHNAPFFHEGSRTTLADAVLFYTSPAFRESPEGDIFFFDFTPAQVNDMVAFLAALVARDYTVQEGSVDVTRAGSAVKFGARFPQDARVTRSLTVRNTSSSKSVRFGSPACTLSVVHGTAAEFPGLDCGQLNGVTLAPGASRTISVGFDPSTSGDKQAIVELNTDDPTGVDLSGQGVRAEVDETFDIDNNDGAARFSNRQPPGNGSFFFTTEGQLRLFTCFTCPAPNGNVITHEFELPASYTLTVDGVALQTDNEFNDFSVIFDFKDLGNYYYASFNERDSTASGADDPNTNGIFKVVNGVRTQIRDFSTTTAPAEFDSTLLHRIRIEKIRGTIRVFRGTTLMGVVTDATFTGGKAGVGSLNDDARFDNFMVRRHVLGEDHTSSASPYLKILGGTFAISGGKLQLTAPASSPTLPNANLAVHPTLLPAGDFELFVEGNATNTTSSNDDFSVVFNYQNATNYMFVNLGDVNDATGNGIFRVVNSVVTQIRDFTSTTAPGTARRISVRRTGAVIQVLRDGSQLGTDVSDTTFSGGQVGIGSRDNAAVFDNVFVEKR